MPNRIGIDREEKRLNLLHFCDIRNMTQLPYFTKYDQSATLIMCIKFAYIHVNLERRCKSWRSEYFGLSIINIFGTLVLVIKI